MLEFPLNGKWMESEESLQTWPYPIPDENYLFGAMVRGDPIPSSRPRVTKSGVTYYPKRYGNYRDSLSFCLNSLFKPLPESCFIDPDIPPERRRYGIRAIFYRKTKQRCDVDNLLKTIFDAGTGIIWKDDSLVDEVFGKIIRSSSDPRVEIIVYETTAAVGDRICKQCGKDFFGFPARTRSFCSNECFLAAQAAKRVHLKCKQCGKDFSVLRCIAKQHKVGFCSKPCSLRYWASQRVLNGSAQWKCVDCGAQVSRKEYRRCNCCERIRRGAKSVHNEGLALQLFGDKRQLSS